MNWLLALVSLFWLAVLVERGMASRYLMSAELFRHCELEVLPPLSVVVAARNEADTIESALASLLQVDYPGLEVVVVNDRSEDDTGELLNRMAAADPSLRVVHNHDLPDGWLGKTHALHLGAEMATGEILLFTDADVHFEREFLRLAVAALNHLRADHLVVAPQVVTDTFWEKIAVPCFTLLFGLKFRPEVVHREPSRFVGVGAFNMLRRSVYQRIGGHRAISLQVADDLILGKLVKREGFQQLFLISNQVRVRWVKGLRGIVLGLEKNGFAGTNYSLLEVVLGCTGFVLLFWLPWLAWFGWWAAWPGWIFQVAVAWGVARLSGWPWWSAFFLPLAGTLLAFALLRSTYLTLWRGGVLWRGTFYPLKLLKAQQI